MPDTRIINISDIDISSRLTIYGKENDGIGVNVAGFRDLNGDGFDDIAVFYSSGKTLIIYGNDGYTGEIAIDSIDVSGSALLTGSYLSDIAVIGDINGDGVDDMVIGDMGMTNGFTTYPDGSTHPMSVGGAHILYGPISNAETIDLSDRSDWDGFNLFGSYTFHEAGKSVSGLGDVNGDGIDDLVVGAPGFGLNGSGKGDAFVVYGTGDGSMPDLVGSDVSPEHGFVMVSTYWGGPAYVGNTVGAAGDFNGDGINDILVSSSTYLPDEQGYAFAWSVNVVYGVNGNRTGPVDLYNVDSSIGLTIIGGRDTEASNDVAAVGDFNGDGLDDVVVAGFADRQSGGSVVAVVFGQSDLSLSSVDIMNFQPGEGQLFYSDEPYARAGWSLEGIGDLNQDGYQDVLIGSGHSTHPTAGDQQAKAWVVFGGEASGDAINLAEMRPDQGFRIDGQATGDAFGLSVAAADFDGDGINDLIIGAPGSDIGGNSSGEIHVIYGNSEFWKPITTQSDTILWGETTTHTLAVSGTVSGLIEQDGMNGPTPHIDKDWFRVTLQGGTTYTFDGSANVSTTDSLDAIALRLYLDNSTSVTQLVEGATPSFTFTAPGTGSTTYYLAVSAGGTGDWMNDTGAYQVSLTDNGPGVSPNRSPMATATNATAEIGTSIALTDLFAFRDLDGATDITSFVVQDRTPGAGHLSFNGVEQDSNTLFERPIEELSQWRFVVGPEADQIGFNAIDQAGAFNQSVAATVTPSQIVPVPLSAEELFDMAGGKITALATFASAAYEKNYESMADLTFSGWNVLNGSSGLSGFSGNHFYNANAFVPQAGIATAIAAESPDGKSLVIAFKGTDSLLTAGGALDWLNNLTGITQHYSLFDSLLLNIDFNSYDHIYITGHSLGAAMAQTLMLDPRFGLSDDPRAESITFANPGSVISPSEYSNDRMVSIAIQGDPVAEIGQLGRVAGDRYTLDHTLPASSDWHGMDWYLAGARYIDGSAFSNSIEMQSENGARDLQELRVQLDWRDGEPWIGTLPRGSVITPTEIVFGIDPSTVQLSDTWSTSVNPSVAGSTPTIIFNAPQYTNTELDVSKTNSGQVVFQDALGVAQFLASEFGSVRFVASELASLALRVGSLQGTDILNQTVYFDGGGQNDSVDAAEAERRLVANGGEGNDTLIGGSSGDLLDGGSGDDMLIGGGGADHLVAGTGADYLMGDAGSDTITLTGTSYHTAQYAAFNVSSATQTGTGQRINLDGKVKIEAVIDGGSDINTIRLGDEGDAFFLHDAYSGFHQLLTLTSDYVGNDSAQRFINIQRIYGLDGDDIIDLTSPDYSLEGTSIMIDGGQGSDVIWGSDADETIYGGVGSDTIFGGVGTDVLFGGADADVFEFTKTSTDTTVMDFDPGEGDLLRFYSTGGALFDASSIGLTDDGIRIAYAEAGTRHEIDIALAASAADFNFSLQQILSSIDFV